MRPSAANDATGRVEMADEGGNGDDDGVVMANVVMNGVFLRPAASRLRLRQRVTGPRKHAVSWLGGCPCENRSDSDAANRSLAHPATSAGAGRTLAMAYLARHGSKSQARRRVMG